MDRRILYGRNVPSFEAVSQQFRPPPAMRLATNLERRLENRR